MATTPRRRPRATATGLTHLDARNRPAMVDIGGKPVSAREAVAEARVTLPAAVARALAASGHRTRKGPVFDTAIIAAVQAVKRTHEWIPFCHPLPLEHCDLDIDTPRSGLVVIRCTVRTTHRTGVEMEALTGATVAALVIYDMCKALSHDIRIGPVRLLTKRGAKRDFAGRAAPAAATAKRRKTGPRR
jgi:cyclic pyranopterin phosphate synthase